ncbi:putative disease resistance protein RGA4 [Rhodamnia argentea]|uniref:Disease resistance protein RGA4 n=1 Tax=Rhodamnia argentea TaxID=178133 RepID=A0ABM3HA25_9MYRT|nr:putative disease resistance protein RGA4 [Rhodamnia argentea]
MAEAVLFSLATNILKSLASEMAELGGSFASQQIQLLCGAKDGLQSLRGTVQTIQAVLLDAEKKQWHNNQVKLWLTRLKDVLYDVQDLLDDVATEDLRRKVTPGNEMSKAVRFFFSKSNQLAHRVKVTNKIQELRKKLDRIKNDRTFHLEERQSEETTAIGRGRKTEIFAPDRAIIGRENDRKMIKHLLFDSSSTRSVSVVAIVGKGGLGKTALARLVYNDGEVKEHFGLKMWVCVSDVFDVNSIVKDILKKANVDCQGHDNDLRGLSEDESWNLFKKNAFEEGEESLDSEQEKIGRDLVKKCVGVPLAVRTIGGLFYSKKKDEWLRYEGRELQDIPEIDEKDGGIMEVLKFSYDHLPSCLKHCFAYCSVFPKDYVYRKEMVIHLWVAQGFIESSRGEDNLDEVADMYLSELLCRSFLDVERKLDHGEVLTFKMHDLMHDLAQKVAGGECKIVNFKGGHNDRGIRHASFTSEFSVKRK